MIRFRQRKLYSSEGCTNQAWAEGVCITMHGDQKVNHRAAPKRKGDASHGENEDGASPKKVSSGEQLPLTDIVGPNDCLIGPGSTGYSSTGNRKYRYLVERKMMYYRSTHNVPNTAVATEIVNEWRALTPPGRFLEQDKDSMMWNDIGDERAKKRVVASINKRKRKSKEELNKILLKKMVPLPPSYPPPGYFINHKWPKLASFNENEEMQSVLI